MSNANNVSQAKPKIGGAISVAPVGTALPTDAKTALNAAFKSLGYITEDGVTNSTPLSVTEVKAWGGDAVINEMDSRGDTFKWSLMESLNVDVLKFIYGDKNVTGTLDTGIKVCVNSNQMTPVSVVVDTILKGGVLQREVIPNANLTAIEDVAYKGGDAIVYGVTVSATPDASNQTHYKYITKAGGAA